MKHLKWLPPLYVAAFPYLCLAALYVDSLREIFPGHPFRLVGILWLVGLVAALALLFTRKHWAARELALANMLIKLVHIPAYIVWFAAGILFFLFMGALLAFFMDILAISLSGLVGLAAALNCWKEGRLPRGKAILYSVFQFVFCVDVIGAVLLYRRARKHKEAA